MSHPSEERKEEDGDYYYYCVFFQGNPGSSGLKGEGGDPGPQVKNLKIKSFKYIFLCQIM